jgi:hypothetical protein
MDDRLKFTPQLEGIVDIFANAGNTPLPTISGEERESRYGYVFAVSGPGEFLLFSQRF